MSRNSPRRFNFNLTIEGETKIVELLYKSLVPEAEEYFANKSKIDLWIDRKVDGGCFYLDIESRDIVSLRASINTWLRLIKVVEDIFKTMYIPKTEIFDRLHIQNKKGGDLN